MLQPKKTKFLKQHRSNLKGIKYFKGILHFGSYGIQSIEAGYITINQIEAVRKILKNYIKPFGKLWIVIFPHQPYTQKSEGSRMGSGKGVVKKWISVIKRGKILFELDNVPLDIAKKACSLASTKLPIKTKFIIK